MVRVKINFPDDMAEEQVDVAKAWEPGMPFGYEAEEYNTKESFEKTNEGITIKTPHIEIELTNEEVDRILKMIEGTKNLIYLFFKNSQDRKFEGLEVGFGRVGKRMASIYACVPGSLRGHDYEWTGSEDKFDRIYALRDPTHQSYNETPDHKE